MKYTHSCVWDRAWVVSSWYNSVVTLWLSMRSLKQSLVQIQHRPSQGNFWDSRKGGVELLEWSTTKPKGIQKLKKNYEMSKSFPTEIFDIFARYIAIFMSAKIQKAHPCSQAQCCGSASLFRLITLMRIRMRNRILIYLFDADTDPYPSIKKGSNPWRFWKMMRIRFRIQLKNFDVDADFYLMRMRNRMRIQVIKMIRIRMRNPNPDADPQHWPRLVSAHCVQPCLSPAACAHSRAMCATHSGPCGR